MTRRTKTITNVFVELSGFDDFTEKLGRLAKGDFITPAFKRYTEHVRDIVVEGTPIGKPDEDLHPGKMKQSWGQPVYSCTSGSDKATITNNADYSYASNYGHYQHVGQYVPTINARLVHSYVPGTYALETSLDKAGLDFDSIIKPEILKIWNDYYISEDSGGRVYDTVRQSYYDRPGEELK